jgi:hypothetical protein
VSSNLAAPTKTSLILKELVHFPPSLFPVSALNCAKTPSVGPDCVKTDPALIGVPVQLAQRFPFHLQLHLRVLLEDLSVPLPKELRHKLVCDSASA